MCSHGRLSPGGPPVCFLKLTDDAGRGPNGPRGAAQAEANRLLRELEAVKATNEALEARLKEEREEREQLQQGREEDRQTIVNLQAEVERGVVS